MTIAPAAVRICGVFNLIPKEKQQAAVKFLLDAAFTAPTWMVDPEILRRIEPVGAIDRVRTAQSRILNTLLSSARFARLVEQETLDGRRQTLRGEPAPRHHDRGAAVL